MSENRSKGGRNRTVTVLDLWLQSFYDRSMTPLSPEQVALLDQPDEKDCANCHNRFRPKRSTQIYCSKACREGRDSPLIIERYCEWCSAVISSDNPKAKFCSDKCRKLAFGAKSCRYCGESANSRDHFIPTAFVRAVTDFAHVEKHQVIVPCCIECNSTAGAKVFTSLKEKRIYIGNQYKKRYKKLLQSPDWTETEINALGHSLRTHIRQSQEHKKILKRRLRKLLRGEIND